MADDLHETVDGGAHETEDGEVFDTEDGNVHEIVTNPTGPLIVVHNTNWPNS